MKKKLIQIPDISGSYIFHNVLISNIY